MRGRTKDSAEESQGASGATSLTRALAAPFEPSEVRFKPAVVSGNRALALAYVDARAIQDRLDAVLGVEGWQDDYECLPDGSVVCRLRLRLGDEWITKVDVGGPNARAEGGDGRKAAFSGALKRAAVKFGIGRYLYRLPSQWVDYDPQRRQFAKPPSLPAFAVPERAAARPAPSPPAPSKTPRPAASHALPANGVELQRRLMEYDAKLAAAGVSRAGALVKHVTEAGARAGHGTDMTVWTTPAISLAIDKTRAFEVQARRQRTERKDVA